MNRTRTLTLLALTLTPLLGGCTAPDPAQTLVTHAITYLQNAQRADGGFASAPNGTSDFATSAWAALALAAANVDGTPMQSMRAYLQAQSTIVEANATGGFSSANALSLYVLALHALDIPEPSWNGIQPSDRLAALAHNDSLQANEQIFLLGALGAAGRGSDAANVSARLHAKLVDPTDADLAEDAWMRSYALLALVAGGTSTNDPDLRAAARSLNAFQVDEKGFRSGPKYGPDASTTSAVIAALARVSFVYGDERGNGVLYLRGLQQPDGSVRFSPEADFGRTKTTAEAILGATGRGAFAA